MKKLSSILIFSLLLADTYIVSGQTYTYTCNTTTEKFSTGRVNQFSLVTGKLDDEIKAGDYILNNRFFGWAIFNISSIPQNATINSVELITYTKEASSTAMHCLYIVHLKSDPRLESTNVGTINNDLASTNIFYADCSPAMRTTGGYTTNLNGLACVYLQNSVQNNDGWWGIYFAAREGDDAGTIYGYSNSNHPKLTVNYTLPYLYVTPNNKNVGSNSDITTFSISSNTSWSAADDVSWLTVSPLSGSGNGTITASFTANTLSSPRIATIRITGSGVDPQYVTVTQSGISTLSITPANRDVGSAAGSTTFSISSNTSWSAADDVSWLTVSPLSGSGDGTITASFTANTLSSPRIATIRITGSGVDPQYVTVTQSGISTLSITPANRDVGSAAGSTTFTISSNTSWTVTDNATWLTVIPTSGSGSGTLTATFTANTSTSNRVGTITISGTGVNSQNVIITQSGASTLSVTPTNRDVGSDLGSTTFSISSNVSWSVTDNADWLTVSPTGGTGDETLTINYEANNLEQSRVAIITVTATGINPQTVTVTQAGLENEPPGKPSLLTPSTGSNVTVPFRISWSCNDPDGDPLTYTLRVRTKGSTTWEDMSMNKQTYLDVTSGVDPGTYEWCIVASDGNAQNTSDIWEFTVIQYYLSVNPANQNISSDAGSTSFSISSNVSWSVTDNADWLTVSPTGGTGDGTLTAAFTGNSSSSSNIATITVTGSGVDPQYVTVTRPCTLIAPDTIFGPISVCLGVTQIYTAPVVPGATSYLWTLPTAWVLLSSTENSITVTPMDNDGVISVTATNSCGIGLPYSLPVSIQKTPMQPGSITGEVNIIPGEKYTYEITPVIGATFYTWTLPSGWTGNSISDSIVVIAGNTLGTISVSANNECGTSQPSTLNIKIIECISPIIVMKWNDVLICNNVDTMIVSYQWYKGSDPIPSANKQYFVTSKVPGNYWVKTIDRNGCISMSNEIRIAAPKSLSIYPNPANKYFTITLRDESFGKTQMRLFNMNGSEILVMDSEKAGYEFVQKIPSEELEEGLYIIQVLVGNSDLYISKIVIVKYK